jgi:hypothetical protein
VCDRAHEHRILHAHGAGVSKEAHELAPGTVDEGRQVPLEFEPSAALASTLERAPVWDSEIRAFLHGSFRAGATGLYTLTPYRPGRVPVVLIHGTASSPARWADLVNELEADPRIAPRIQLWFFAYHTGLPILYSGGLLRESRRRWPSWIRHHAVRYEPSGVPQ